MELYPGWSARDNYGYGSKKKKRKKDRSPADSGGTDWSQKKIKVTIFIFFLIFFYLFLVEFCFIWFFYERKKNYDKWNQKKIDFCFKFCFLLKMLMGLSFDRDYNI